VVEQSRCCQAVADDLAGAFQGSEFVRAAAFACGMAGQAQGRISAAAARHSEIGPGAANGAQHLRHTLGSVQHLLVVFTADLRQQLGKLHDIVSVSRRRFSTCEDGAG
jgi:hypothetical protein